MFTIREFCQECKISERMFHLLKAQGRGPSVTRIGRRVLISKETAAEWLKSQERAA